MLRTDVVELGQVVPTGRDYCGTRVDQATAGVVVLWDVVSKAAVNDTGESSLSVILSRTERHRRPLPLPVESGAEFHGELYLKSTRPGPCDAAIVRVFRSGLVAGGVIKESFGKSPAPRLPKPYRPCRWMTWGDSGRITEHRVARMGQLRFTCMVSYPHFKLPRWAGCTAWCQSYREPPTRSAQVRPVSYWQVRLEPAAIQVAAKEFEFQHGFGQALETLLAWAEAQLSRRDGLRTGKFSICRGVLVGEVF